MFLVRIVAAGSVWGRAFAAPLFLLGAGAGLLWVVRRVGENRLWSVLIVGAALVGLALGWGAWAAINHRRCADRRDDGEGEPL